MDKVLILMSTYNGQRYIREQLSSIYAQTGVDCELLVRDDGSSDATLQVLEDESRAGRLHWYSGVNKGPAWSFWDLVMNASDSDWYAFSDQDDVWASDKMSVAVACLKDHADTPALYFGQTQLVDEQLRPMQSVIIHPRLTYGEALMYQFVGGCTMVFNHALRLELLKYKPQYIRMHDVWVYDVALALGAYVCFDEVPRINYRQHGGNAVGQVDSALFRWRERWRRWRKQEKIRSCLVRELWNGYAEQMPEENRRLTEKVLNYRRINNKFSLVCGHDLDCANRFVSVAGRISILFNLF